MTEFSGLVSQAGMYIQMVQRMDLHFGWGEFSLCGEMRLSFDQALLLKCHDFMEMLSYKYKHNTSIVAVWCSLNALCH